MRPLPKKTKAPDDTCDGFGGLSIVVPYYNQPQRIMACLQSVQRSLQKLSAHDQSRIELLVIDDHSPVPFSAAGLTLKVRSSRMPQNRGVGAARNQGLALSSQSNVLFMDDDIELDESFLPTCFERLNCNPDIRVLQGPHSGKPANPNPGLFQHYLAISWKHIMAHELVTGSTSACFYSGCVIVNRRFFLDFGGFSEAYAASGGEEFEVAARLSRLGSHGIVCDDALVSYHHFDSLPRRLKKVLRRSTHLTSTVGRITALPASFRRNMVLRLLSGVALLLTIPALWIGEREALIGYGALSIALALTDFSLTGRLVKSHSLLLGIASIFFRQIEYACVALGITVSLFRR